MSILTFALEELTSHSITEIMSLKQGRGKKGESGAYDKPKLKGEKQMSSEVIENDCNGGELINPLCDNVSNRNLDRGL